MEPDLPNWLNHEFLSSVIEGRKATDSSVTILSFSASSAVSTGNNYTSHIYRILVKYNVGSSDVVQSTSLIIKSPICKGFIQSLSEQIGFFKTEPLVYEKLLPNLYELSNVKFGPKAFYSPLPNILVLHDMREDDYAMCDRLKQLDFSHCEIVFVTLAKFHATSLAFHRDHPEFVENIGEERLYVEKGPFTEMKTFMIDTIKNSVQVLLENGIKHPVLDLISNKSESIWESLIELVKPKSNCINVLNHGDCWTSNILFKHNDEGEVIDLKFVDYQLARYTSPVFDLTYFMWTSANEDVRENRQSELYRIYLNTFNKSLTALGVEKYLTSEELQESLQSVADWILVTIFCTLPYIMCETKDVLDMEEINTDNFYDQETSEKLKNVCSSKHYRALFPAILMHYESSTNLVIENI